MHVVYSQEVPPSTFARSLFLAGPSPRTGQGYDWRKDALTYLAAQGYDGIVFIPLPRNDEWPHSYDDQVDWENTYLHMADEVVFWVPRDLTTLPGFTTNVEYGMWFDTGKCILGYPKDAPKMRYLSHHANLQKVPTFHSLEDTLNCAMARLGNGAKRTGGEREIPLYIWRTNHFQQWYRAQQGAGNSILDARVLVTYTNHDRGNLFLWGLHVRMHIATENRVKTNEFVLGRPDISTVVAYQPAATVGETRIVLVREYRLPSRTPDSFIRELPGGSSWDDSDAPETVASEEVCEETGVTLDPSRFRPLGARQVAGTFSPFSAHAFAYLCTNEEMEHFVTLHDVCHGVASDSERTYVEVHTLQSLISGEVAVDWSTLGMILTALTPGA